MALNFKKADEELVQLVENNPCDERIYQLLHDITFNYLFNVLNPGSIYYDYETIAWDLAADLFLRIRKGTRISHFVSYISHVLKSYYLRYYENNNWSIIIDPAMDDNLDKAIRECCGGTKADDNDRIENVLTGIYFSQFESIIEKKKKKTKFNYTSKDRLNVEISVLLTLNKGKEIYFRIDDALRPYIRIIITKIKDKLVLDGIFDRDTCPTINLNADTNYIPEDLI